MRESATAEHQVHVAATLPDDRLEADPRLTDAKRGPVRLDVDEGVHRSLDLDNALHTSEPLKPLLVRVLKPDRHEHRQRDEQPFASEARTTRT